MGEDILFYISTFDTEKAVPQDTTVVISSAIQPSSISIGQIFPQFHLIYYKIGDTLFIDLETLCAGSFSPSSIFLTA